MRKILISGLVTCFLLAIILVVLNYLIDLLQAIFGPLVLLLFGKEYLEAPLGLVFGFVIVVIVGALVSHSRVQNLVNRYFKRVPDDVRKGRGALVLLSPGAYYLAVVMKEVDLVRQDGRSTKHYVLYTPSVPLPWTGLPVIVVEKDKVIPLRLSFAELYSIIGSYGRNAPESLKESKS